MKLVNVSVCIAIVFQAACTSNPKNIKPEYTSPRLYSSFSCDELFEEQRKIQDQVDDLVKRQKSNRTTDTVMTTVGLVILWPALLALPFTKDRKREIARYMGQDEAIKENIDIKKCTYANREQQAEQMGGSEAKPAPVLKIKASDEISSEATGSQPTQPKTTEVRDPDVRPAPLLKIDTPEGASPAQ